VLSRQTILEPAWSVERAQSEALMIDVRAEVMARLDEALRLHLAL
jgi:hypothetical protein